MLARTALTAGNTKREVNSINPSRLRPYRRLYNFPRKTKESESKTPKTHRIRVEGDPRAGETRGRAGGPRDTDPRAGGRPEGRPSRGGRAPDAQLARETLVCGSRRRSLARQGPRAAQSQRLSAALAVISEFSENLYKSLLFRAIRRRLYRFTRKSKDL